MKRVKKIVSMLLAVIMVLGMSMTVFADDTDLQTVDSGKGGSGSITIDGSNRVNANLDGVAVAGKTFMLYKVLDAEFANGADDKGGVVYKVPAVLKDFYSNRFGVDVTDKAFDTKVVAKLGEYEDDSEELETFAKDILAEAKKYSALCMATVSVDDKAKSVKVTGLLLGYYVIEDVVTAENDGEDAVPVSALILNTTTPDVTVKVKANAPSITKDIVEPEVICETPYHVHDDSCYDEGELSCEKGQHVHVAACYDPEKVAYVKYNDAAIGDTVNYRVTSPMPNMAGYAHYFFVVNDTMAKGLKFNNDVVIKINGEELAKDKTIEGLESGYTVTPTKNADGSTAIEIVLQNFIQYKGVVTPGTEIEITYSAEVTEDVEVGPTGNENEVGLKFPANHDENSWWDPENPDKPRPETPVGETPKQKVRTYVTGLDLLKVDAADRSKVLTGAEFTITGEALNKVLVTTEVFVEDNNGEYYLLKDGTYTTTAPTIAQDETDNTNLYEYTDKKYKKGEAETETETVEGFSYTGTVDASGHLKIDGLKEGNYVITEAKAPNGYNILDKPIYITVGCIYPTTNNGEGDCTWTVNTTTGDDGIDAQPAIVEGVISLTVANSSGLLLPSTGGIGTTIFYVAGSILVLLAVVLLVAKKRMSAEK